MKHLTWFVLLFLSCGRPSGNSDEAIDSSIFGQVEQVPDSIVVDNIRVYNVFKYQILAHQNNDFDSALIVDNVYRNHRKIWDSLYAVLFDKQMFSTKAGMIEWNKRLFVERADSIELRTRELLESRFAMKLESALKGLKELTGRSPADVRLHIILAPLEGIGFGGIENDAFVLDLLDNNFDVVNMVEEGVPHELNHFIYDQTRSSDPNKGTPLRLTIDEGFACYYTYKYFDGRLSKAQAVEQMNEQDWQWYLDHEKEIYEKCEPYFFYAGDSDPLRKLGQELNAPKTLFYWLGFRVVEFYVNKHGLESWLDIYDLPVKDVLDKSGYKDYIQTLKRK